MIFYLYYKKKVSKKIQEKKWIEKNLLTHVFARKRCSFFFTSNGIQKCSPEVLAHEAVGHRVAKCGAVGEQMHEGHSLHAQNPVHQLGVKQGHHIQDIDRCPANEKLEDHNADHFNGPSSAIEQFRWSARSWQSTQTLIFLSPQIFVSRTAILECFVGFLRAFLARDMFLILVSCLRGYKINLIRLEIEFPAILDLHSKLLGTTSSARTRGKRRDVSNNREISSRKMKSI